MNPFANLFRRKAASISTKTARPFLNQAKSFGEHLGQQKRLEGVMIAPRKLPTQTSPTRIPKPKKPSFGSVNRKQDPFLASERRNKMQNAFKSKAPATPTVTGRRRTRSSAVSNVSKANNSYRATTPRTRMRSSALERRGSFALGTVGHRLSTGVNTLKPRRI